MTSEGSVTRWIDEIKVGESFAARAIWERYFERLVHLARGQLRGAPRQVADEEDVALSALKSFCVAAQRGRFPDLADRDGLWRLLLKITARKAVDHRRSEGRQRRGGGLVRMSANPAGGSSPDCDVAIAEVVSETPTPEFAMILAEEYGRLLEQLDEADLRAIALAKMEGYTNEEIASQLSCSVRTVERRLRLIRKKWACNEVQ